MKQNIFKNKSILVTGGTGSFGQRFIEVCSEQFKPKKIIVFSRDELKQFEMAEKFKERKFKNLRFFLGDVRDVTRLKFAMENVDYVIHAAALKHVPIAEYNPFEAVKTNIMGAQNVIEAAISCGVKKVIALSTDKAAAPINLYGATKLTSDKLFISANNFKGKKDIKFSVVRYGNVMGSRGSVIPYFLEFKEKGYIPITDKQMTRFNITLDEGVNFVLDCLKKMWGGELFVPKIPSYRIVDVAKAIVPNIKYKIIGMRPGEKLHEEMITESDSFNTVEFKNYFVIIPDSKNLSWDRNKFIKTSSSSPGKMCKRGFCYSSKTNNHFLSVNNLKNLIKKNIY